MKTTRAYFLTGVLLYVASAPFLKAQNTIILSGPYTISGTASGCSSSNVFSDSGTITFTLQTPTPNAFGITAGSVSGGVGASGTFFFCGYSYSDEGVHGTVEGSLSSGGELNLQISIPDVCSFSASGTTNQISGTIPGSCFHESASGTFSASNQSSAPRSTITSLVPASAAAGGASFMMAVNGTGFAQGSVVQWIGAALPTTYVSATQLIATVPAIDIQSAGTAAISVLTNGYQAAAATFTITQAVPTITSLNPSTATAGGPAFTLTVNGTGFATGAVVNWGGQGLPTTFFETTQLSATVPAIFIANPGTAGITVTSGTVTTGAANFTITPNTNPPLTMSCSPSTGPATAGVSYAANCKASGGTSPYSWSIGAGSLPAGLVSSGGSGSTITISGTPSAAGPYSYTVKVADSGAPQQSQTQAFAGTIAPAATAIGSLSCTSTNGPVGVGVRYADTCTAPNGTAPFSWSVTGSLPAGVALIGSATNTAAITGTPASTGSYSYTLNVTDSTKPTPLSGSQNFSGTVAAAGSPALTVVPSNLTFSYRPDTGTSPPASLSIFATGTVASFSVSSNAAWLSATGASGQTPESVTVAAANVSSFAPGTYTAQLTVTAANVNPPMVTVPVSLIVQAVPGPQLTVSQNQFAYALTQGSAAVQGQLMVTNTGGGQLSFTTSVTGCSCVSADVAAGEVSAHIGVPVIFTVNPAGLPPSTYSSAIVITASDSETATIPVKTAVASQSGSIVLTQSGLSFGAVPQGAAPPAQSYSILNTGQDSLNWTTTTQTLSGGSSWLSVTPAAGTVAAGATSAPVSITVNPSGLAGGEYYGIVRTTAPNAANSPEITTVLLNVVDPSQGAIVVSPTGALIGSILGTSLTQTVTIYNLSTTALTYTSTVSTADGGNWLMANPATGSVPAQGSAQLTLAPGTAALPNGTGQGIVRLGFSNGITQAIAVSSLVTSGTTNSALKPEQSSGCKASSLVPTVTSSIGPAFTVTQGQPVSLVVSLVDNCHNAPSSGAGVSAVFTNGDPSLTMVAQGGGVWSGTWTPKTPSAQVTINFAAEEVNGINAIGGFATLTGTVQPAASSEAPAPANALNSAFVNGTAQISPGSWVTILGDRLADGPQAASGTFPAGLNGTQVLLHGESLPLNYVSANQVNALLPYSLEPNTVASLSIQRDQTLSVPISVTLADIGPAIFSTNGEGTQQGAITIASSGVVAAPAGTFPGSQPVNRGDFIAIYCTGLGAVSNTPADGAPAPSSPPFSTTPTAPTVTIGGVQVTPTYNGLAPGLVGLYQVNAQVPQSSPTGSAVPLTITMNGLASNTVTIAIQ